MNVQIWSRRGEYVGGTVQDLSRKGAVTMDALATPEIEASVLNTGPNQILEKYALLRNAQAWLKGKASVGVMVPTGPAKPAVLRTAPTSEKEEEYASGTGRLPKPALTKDVPTKYTAEEYASDMERLENPVDCPIAQAELKGGESAASTEQLVKYAVMRHALTGP